LKHKNYRLFFGGQIISLTGSWMQQVALSWLVYRITGSAFILGLVGFSSQIPILILSPIAGVLIDRMNKHRIIIATQILLMLQAFLLTFLIFSNVVEVWHIILLNIFSGVINAFDLPARQSFIVEIVEKREDLGNAIALNSSIFNSARLAGPSIAGILISAAGEGICFLINALSFVAVITALLVMKIKPHHTETKHSDMLQGFKEGIKYTFGFIPIRTILLLIALISIVGMPYTILMPVFAKEILHGGPHTLGFLLGAIGIGALCGAFYLASRNSVLGLGKIIAIAASSFGLGLILFSLSRNFVLSMAMLVITGMSMMVQMSSSNTILQTIVEDKMRGRVMSFYTTAFTGMAPFGSLMAGFLASKIGATNTLIIGGLCCLTGAALFAKQLPLLKGLVRPIYVKMGIIPEVAEGLQRASNLRVPPEN
ncbi:MAG TPA: MFS transporter, partial [Ignavibacteriaceae bacterium]|nr:MFS transporter [Ignavibacteriaceae bacterium]